MDTIRERARHIQCLICDVDGVLTDGLLYLNEEGREQKAFHIQDGMGLKLLMAAGIEVAVITTSRNEIIDHRMQQLGILHYFKGQVDKRQAFETLKKTLRLPNEAFAYIGDDLPDLPLIRQVGLGVAVANAVAEIKEYAHWQTTLPGGRGGVRELCDLILQVQGKTNIALNGYLSSC